MAKSSTGDVSHGNAIRDVLLTQVSIQPLVPSFVQPLLWSFHIMCLCIHTPKTVVVKRLLLHSLRAGDLIFLCVHVVRLPLQTRFKSMIHNSPFTISITGSRRFTYMTTYNLLAGLDTAGRFLLQKLFTLVHQLVFVWKALSGRPLGCRIRTVSSLGLRSFWILCQKRKDSCPKV